MLPEPRSPQDILEALRIARLAKAEARRALTEAEKLETETESLAITLLRRTGDLCHAGEIYRLGAGCGVIIKPLVHAAGVDPDGKPLPAREPAVIACTADDVDPRVRYGGGKSVTATSDPTTDSVMMHVDHVDF